MAEGDTAFDETTLARVLRALPDGVVIIDQAAQILWVNDAFTEMTGWPFAEIVGRNGLDLLDPDELVEALEALSIVREAPGSIPPGAYKLAHRDGGYVTLELHAAPIDPTDDASPTTLLMRHLEYQRVENAGVELLGSDVPVETIARFVVERIGWPAGAIAVAFDDEDGVRVAVRGSLPEALDGTVTPEDGEAPWDEAARTGVPVDRPVEELPASLREVAEAAGFVRCTADTVPDPGGRDAVVVLWFVPGAPTSYRFLFTGEPRYLLLRLALERRHLQAALRRAATSDHLTGLANRARFFDSIERSTAEHAAVVYLDLDDFKPINDQHGHLAGDEALREIGRRLQATVRAGDLVARLGGDEFAVFCPGLHSRGAASDLAARLHAAITEPITVHDVEVRVGASIGVAVTTTEGTDAMKLVDAADALLYELKRDGKDGWRVESLA